MSEKLKFRVECDDDGISKCVRLHRQFFGRSPSALPVELEFEEDEPVFGFLAKDDEPMFGRYFKVEGGFPGLTLTSDPSLYGTDIDRENAGLMPLKRLRWGEFSLIEIN